MSATLGYCLDTDCRIGFVAAEPCHVCDSTGDTPIDDWTLTDVLKELSRPKSHRQWGPGLMFGAIGLDPEMTVAELREALATPMNEQRPQVAQ